MKNKGIYLILLFILLVASCGTNRVYDETYGYRIDEDLSKIDIINDNYRNYYEIFVRSFADSNDDGIGDLNGVTSKLNYLSDLGYTGIWLMPINESPSYHKYDVEDYYKIDEQYGTMNDLINLINESHKRNIKVIIDLVLNHSSITNKKFILSGQAYDKYLSGKTLTNEENILKDYYSFFENKDDDKAKGKKIYQYPGKNFYYEANFDSSMPEFNLNSEYVLKDIKELVKFYLNKGVDGFRLDATLYYFYGEDNKNIKFLNEFNKYVKSINPESYIVGECWSSSSTINKYYQSGIDSFFYFPGSVSDPNGFITNSTNRDGIYCQNYFSGMEAIIKNANGYIPAPFLDNHDMSRVSRSIKNINKYFYGLLSMINGTTFTYYGDEIGMTGNVKPDENVRNSLIWDENDPSNTEQITGTTNAEYKFGDVQENLEDENSILKYYKKTNYLRNKFPEIARGEPSLVEVDKDIGKLIINKTYQNNTITIVFNFSSTNTFTIDIGELNCSKVVGQLVVDNSKYIGELKNKNIIIPAYGIAILN